MKKRFLLSLMLGAFALSGVAQDDMYFVPSKKSNARVQDVRMASSGAYYSGSMRSVDDYNRRWASSYEVLPADTGDVVSFAPVEGVYPDSLGDFALTQRMASVSASAVSQRNTTATLPSSGALMDRTRA